MDVPRRPADANAEARRDIVVEWLGQLDPTTDDWDAKLSPVAMTIVDAMLEGDAETLQALGEPLRDALASLFDDTAHAREARGYLIAALAITRWAMQRLPDPAVGQIDRTTHAWQMLTALSHEPQLTSTVLRERLSTNESQVSRVGRQLLASGLVAQRRAGRTAVWELTPRGRQAVRQPEDANGGRRARAR